MLVEDLVHGVGVNGARRGSASTSVDGRTAPNGQSRGHTLGSRSIWWVTGRLFPGRCSRVAPLSMRDAMNNFPLWAAHRRVVGKPMPHLPFPRSSKALRRAEHHDDT